MASTKSLTTAEISLIKGMLQLRPKLSKQAILSYFTRPGRDLNHRIISEIETGQRSPETATAPVAAVHAFMTKAMFWSQTIADDFDWQNAPPPWRADLKLDWWSAGQGLFATGMITRSNDQPLSWVYDCGTTSSQSILTKSLDAFKTQYLAYGTRSIRLAVLSHFDKDHLSGLTNLLDQFPIRTLLLPYIPRWQRLVIALEEGVAATDPDFEFFINPSAYISNLADGRVEEIVYVQASGSDDLPPPAEDPDTLDDGGEGSERSFDEDLLKVEDGEAPAASVADPSSHPQPSVAVRFLRRGGRLIVPDLWEFVPYNDAALASSIRPAFIKKVEALTDDLLNTPSSRDTALASLKEEYEKIFKTSEKRNLISLFMYSGPIGRRLYLRNCKFGMPNEPYYAPRFSQMYTGDGYLDNKARFDAFSRFFTLGDRLKRSAFLQVMHHGAAKNWQNGLAEALNPQWSIFSSNPDHKTLGHPHAEVLRDFWPYGAVQVDKTQGFHFHGLLESL